MKRYIWNFLISLDQFFNTLLGGDPDETISSRAARAREHGSKVGRIACSILDWLDPDHCKKSEGA